MAKFVLKVPSEQLLKELSLKLPFSYEGVLIIGIQLAKELSMSLVE